MDKVLQREMQREAQADQLVARLTQAPDGGPGQTSDSQSVKMAMWSNSNGDWIRGLDRSERAGWGQQNECKSTKKMGMEFPQKDAKPHENKQA